MKFFIERVLPILLAIIAMPLILALMPLAALIVISPLIAINYVFEYLTEQYGVDPRWEILVGFVLFFGFIYVSYILRKYWDYQSSLVRCASPMMISRSQSDQQLFIRILEHDRNAFRKAICPIPLLRRRIWP